jgi:hypothetical protein
MSHTRVYEWCDHLRADQKKVRQVKSKVKSLLIFFYINGIVHKEFVLASQTVSSAYYCDILRWLRENVQRLRPELWRQKNCLLHHNTQSHISFSPGNFWPKTTWLSYPHSYFSLFPGLKIKLKGRHFDNWGDQSWIAGSAEHPRGTQLTGCIEKNGRNADVHTRERDYFGGDGGQ